MPQYSYSALAKDGVTMEGSLFAKSTSEAVETLSRKGWTATRVHLQQSVLPNWRRVPLAHQIPWYSMFADMLSAGMPIAKSLELLVDRTSHPILSATTLDIRSRVLQGETLSQAMRNHPALFRDLEIALVNAGEEGAFLETALERVAEIKQSNANLRSKLISASAYPLFLLIVGAIVLVGMLLFFVPKFEPLFDRMKELGTLPMPTQILFAINHAAASYWPVIAVALFAAGYGIYHWLGQSRNAPLRDRILLKNPMIGKLIEGIVLSRFCHLLGTLLTSGVKIQKAVMIAGKASGNLCLEIAATEGVEKITAGQSLADAFSRESIFPREIVEMIRIGEQTNRLEKVLLSTSLRLEARNEKILEVVLKLIEPILMAVMAALIGFLMIALLMPIFNASGQTFQ